MPLNTPEEKLTSQLLVAAAPVDAKTLVATLAERDAIPLEYRYHMMAVKVQENSTIYILSNALDLTNTGWILNSIDVPYSEIYVSPTSGDDVNRGTRNAPVATLEQAWVLRQADPFTRYNIILPENYFPAGALNLGAVANASAETYITGFPGPGFLRWGAGWGQMNFVDVGFLYFNGIGFYTGIRIEQSDPSLSCYVSFRDNEVFGEVEIVENNPGQATIRVSGSTGRIDITSLVTAAGTRLDGTIRVDGGAALNLATDNAIYNKIDAIFGADIFVTSNTAVEVEDLSIRSGTQVNLFRPLLVTESYRNEGASLVLQGSGVLTIDGGATVVDDSKTESSLHQYNNNLSLLTATDVQSAIDEVKEITDSLAGSSIYLGAFDPATPPANPPTDGDTVNYSQGDFGVVDVAGFWNFTTGDQTPDGGGDNVADLDIGDQIRFNQSATWDVIPHVTPVATILDKNLTPSSTSGDASSSSISLTKATATVGYLAVYVNGLLANLTGDLLGECFFSGDGGTTPKALGAAVNTDVLFWNGVIAGYDLAVTDRIDLLYS